MDKENEPAQTRPDLNDIRQRIAAYHIGNGPHLAIDKTQNSSGVSSPAYQQEDKKTTTTTTQQQPVNVKSRVSTTPATGGLVHMRSLDANALPNSYDLGPLAQLTGEILAYCHLLDSSRKRALDDCTGLRTNIKELEKLLESARQREVAHLSYVEQQREAMAMFEKRYYSLKSRAKGLIHGSQEELQKAGLELEELKAKSSLMEAKLYSAQTLNDEQSKELDRLRELSKNTPSERELQDIRLSILKLKDENGRLATERANLIDEMKTLRKKSTSNNAGAMNRDLAAKKEEELESTIQSLTRDNQELRDALEAAKTEGAELQNVSSPPPPDQSQLFQYVSILLDRLDALDPGKAQ